MFLHGFNLRFFFSFIQKKFDFSKTFKIQSINSSTVYADHPVALSSRSYDISAHILSNVKRRRNLRDLIYIRADLEREKANGSGGVGKDLFMDTDKISLFLIYVLYYRPARG